jgi:hypothetical protein
MGHTFPKYVGKNSFFLVLEEEDKKTKEMAKREKEE